MSPGQDLISDYIHNPTFKSSNGVKTFLDQLDVFASLLLKTKKTNQAFNSTKPLKCLSLNGYFEEQVRRKLDSLTVEFAGSFSGSEIEVSLPSLLIMHNSDKRCLGTL